MKNGLVRMYKQDETPFEMDVDGRIVSAPEGFVPTRQDVHSAMSRALQADTIRKTGQPVRGPSDELKQFQQSTLAQWAAADAAAAASRRAGGGGRQSAPAAPKATTEKPMTEAQAKATLFGRRMEESDKVLNTVGKDGQVQPGLIKRAAESVPGIGSGLGTALNWTQSPEQQQVEQAQRDYVNAVLRRESGAVISDQEFDNARKQYFPQPGDSPEVIAQKNANRQLVISGFKAESGAGWDRVQPAAPNVSGAQWISEARNAIHQGAPKAAVIQRLEAQGIMNHGIK